MLSARARVTVLAGIALIVVIAHSPLRDNASAAGTFPTPISFYSFDETTGAATVADSIRGASGEGTLFNSPTFATGRVGNALCLNGTSQYATAPILSGVTTEFTISVWARLDTFTTWATIVKNWSNSTVGTFHFGLDGSTQKWSNYLGLVGNGTVAVNDQVSTTLSQWHHIVTTASQSTGRIRLYVNNVMVDDRAFSGTITSIGTSMSFGAKLNDAQSGPDGMNPGWLDGCLDELAFWDRALTVSEVSDIYTSGQSSTSPIAPAQSTSTTTTTVAQQSSSTTSTTVAQQSSAVTTTTVTTSTTLTPTTSSVAATLSAGDVETSGDDTPALPTAGNGTTLTWVALWLVAVGIATMCGTRRTCRR